MNDHFFGLTFRNNLLIVLSVFSAGVKGSISFRHIGHRLVDDKIFKFHFQMNNQELIFKKES